MFYSDFFWGMLGYFIGYSIWYLNWKCEEKKPWPSLDFNAKDVILIVCMTLVSFTSNVVPQLFISEEPKVEIKAEVEPQQSIGNDEELLPEEY